MKREKKDYVVITFHTTAEEMAAEKYCMGRGIKGRLIPVPREISAGCGICWRMAAEDFDTWLEEVKYDRLVKIRM